MARVPGDGGGDRKDRPAAGAPAPESRVAAGDLMAPAPAVPALRFFTPLARVARNKVHGAIVLSAFLSFFFPSGLRD